MLWRSGTAENTRIIKERVTKTQVIKPRFYNTCKACDSLHRKKHREENREYHAARHRTYRANNKEKLAELNRNWMQANRERHNSQSAKRRALEKSQSCPLTYVEQCWVEFYYDDCAALTKQTGIQHHVDHIQPISKGGLHAPWNLQVLTAEDNLRKADKWHSEVA